jgi:hypothetical protein
VTHVVNASPIVPCFHRKRLRYRSICVYDDEQDDIAQHFASAIAFIAKVWCLRQRLHADMEPLCQLCSLTLCKGDRQAAGQLE